MPGFGSTVRLLPWSVAVQSPKLGPARRSPLTRWRRRVGLPSKRSCFPFGSLLVSSTRPESTTGGARRHRWWSPPSAVPGLGSVSARPRMDSSNFRILLSIWRSLRSRFPDLAVSVCWNRCRLRRRVRIRGRMGVRRYEMIHSFASFDSEHFLHRKSCRRGAGTTWLLLIVILIYDDKVHILVKQGATKLYGNSSAAAFYLISILSWQTKLSWATMLFFWFCVKNPSFNCIILCSI
jgi:hypothetical protein